MATDRGAAEAGAEAIGARTAAGEFVFLNLRLRQGFELSEFAARFGYEFDAAFGPQASRALDCGLLMRENGRIRLSERGLELADSVFAEFV
jgi:oxygen-independent coproporphyrinogen-3 oxidase